MSIKGDNDFIDDEGGNDDGIDDDDDKDDGDIQLEFMTEYEYGLDGHSSDDDDVMHNPQ